MTRRSLLAAPFLCLRPRSKDVLVTYRLTVDEDGRVLACETVSRTDADAAYNETFEKIMAFRSPWGAFENPPYSSWHAYDKWRH